jgi:hypothetical protein
MALRALNGSSDTCRWATPLKVRPGSDDSFAIGCWVRTSVYGDFPRIMGWWNSADINYVQMQILTGSPGTQFTGWDRRNIGTIGSADIYNAVAPDNKWRYSIVRVISTTSMRANTLWPEGNVLTNSSATDLSILDTTGINELSFGWDTADAAVGDIAELWIAGPDPFKGLTDVPRDLMYQIAYNGPFSYAPVAGSLQFYASFEQGIRTDVAGHYIAPSPLKVVAGVQSSLRVSPHPPIAPGYIRPTDSSSIGIV